MFDIGWDELLVIAIVALVVIGPKDLPQAFRIAGRWMAKARALARDFQSHIDDLMRESELDELKREFSDMTRPPELDDLESELMTGQVPVKKPEEQPAVAPNEAAPVQTQTETDPSRAA
ncbi:MAG: Sec-independent protein translocase protein TatB [Micropepsaceae bacterium]